jgi:hypothetical protein
MATAVGIARAGDAIGRVGVAHYEAVPSAQPLFYKNVIVGGGPAPVRAHVKEPGRVFDRTVDLDGVRLPRDEQPRVHQGDGQTLTAEQRYAERYRKNVCRRPEAQKKVSPKKSLESGHQDSGVWRRSRFGQHLEDVAPKDLVEKVYRPDIADKLGQLYEKPGYNPL